MVMDYGCRNNTRKVVKCADLLFVIYASAVSSKAHQQRVATLTQEALHISEQVFSLVMTNISVR